MKSGTQLRIARPTDRLEEVVGFYRDGLGLEEIGSFVDHDGFDGVMLGAVGQPYHLELTRQRRHSAGGSPSPEHLLVFYLPDRAEWQSAVDRMERHGCVAIASHNPYWDRNGVTFADPDGYRVVLQNASWPPAGGE